MPTDLILCGSARRHGLIRIRAMFACLWMTLSLTATTSKCRGDDETFREFSRSNVPSPAELGQLIALLHTSHRFAGSGANPLFQQLESEGRSFLEGLSPDQRSHLRQLASDYLSRLETPTDLPSVMNAASQLRSQLLSDPRLPPEFRQRLSDALQGQSGQASPAQVGSETSAGNGTGSQPSNAGRGGETRNSPSVTENPNQGSRKGSGPRTLPSGRGAVGDAMQGNGAPSSSRSAQAVTPRPDSRRQSPSRRRTPSREQLGTQFDRILVQAAAQAMENRDRATDQPDIVKQVNSVFDRLVKDVKQTVGDGNPQLQRSLNQQWRRAQRRARSETSKLNGFWRRRPFGESLESAALSSKWLALWIPLLAGLVVAGWLVWRRLTRDAEKEISQLDKIRRFKLSKIQTAGDLVRVLDEFLLVRFGLGSQWWHAQRARVALFSSEPALSNEIADLMGRYERARYGPPEQVPSVSELHLSHRTMERLASSWLSQRAQPGTRGPVAESEAN